MKFNRIAPLLYSQFGKCTIIIIMKENCIKYLILFFFSLLLNSCQKDNNNPIDPIIGNWKLAVVRQNDSLVNLNPCVLKSTIEIYIDTRLCCHNYVSDTLNICKAYTHVKKGYGSNGA